jgi:hypothetical protein
MARSDRAKLLTDFFQSILPDAVRQIDQGKAELVQTGAWLVGLASALLALFVSNRDKVNFISVVQAKWIVGLLGLSVLCGVVQRLCLIAAGFSEATSRFRLIGWLIGYGSEVDLADPLNDEWTAEEIVDRLQRHYDLDYAFLLDSPGARDRLRQIYSQTHAGWGKIDSDALRAVYRQIGSYVGWSAEKIEKQTTAFLEGGSGDSTDMVHHTSLFGVAAFALLVGSVAFGAAVTAFCVAFLIH